MLVLVTGGAGFIGSHVVDGPARARPRRAPARRAAAQRARRPARRAARRAELIEGDVRDPDVRVGRAGRRRRRLPPGGDGRPRASTSATSPTTSRHNDLGTAQLLRRAGRARLRRAGRAGQLAWSSTARAATAAPSTASCGPGPRAIADLDAGRFEPPCPVCGRPLGARGGPRGRARSIRATSTPRPSSTRSTCCDGVGARDRRRPRGRRCATTTSTGRGCPATRPTPGVARIFRSSLEAGDAPQVFEDGGQLRDFVHVRDVARANVLALERRRSHGPFNVATGNAAQRRRDGRGARRRGAAARRPRSPATTASATCATSSPPPTAPATCSGCARRSRWRRGWRSSRRRRCAGPPAARRSPRRSGSGCRRCRRAPRWSRRRRRSARA